MHYFTPDIPVCKEKTVFFRSGDCFFSRNAYIEPEIQKNHGALEPQKNASYKMKTEIRHTKNCKRFYEES